MADFPHSQAAEVSVLGAMLIEDEARNAALERLEAADFTDDGLRRIFAAFGRLNGRGQAGDVVALSEELKATGDLDDVGGMAGLAQLVDAVPTAANLPQHVDRLRELRSHRDLRELSERAMRASVEAGPGRGWEVVAETLQRVRAIRDPASPSGDVDLVNMADWLQDPDALAPPESVARGMAYVGQTTLLFADPKAGKTTVAVALSAAVSSGTRWMGARTRKGPILYLAAEGDREEIMRRLHRFGARPEAVDVVVPGAAPLAELRMLTRVRDYALVVIDTLGKWMAPLDVDRWKQSEVDTVLTPLERTIRDAGAALVAIHHANAEGKPIDSTAFAAWADVLRKVEDGTSSRERRVTDRARFTVPDLRFRLVEDDDRARLLPVDPNRETEDKALELLEADPGASKRAIRDGVDARAKDVDRALDGLTRDGIVEVDRSGRAHTHRIAQNPHGHATDTVRTRSGHRGAENEASTVSERGGKIQSISPFGTRSADSAVEEDPHEQRRCACGTTIGLTAIVCGACKKRRRQTLERLPDPDEVRQVGEPAPTTPVSGATIIGDHEPADPADEVAL